ncbi:MAG: hypothetical protein JRI68_21720 [Deltaproteobacteria bacterium]|nr:hypothetical protein [Deltaproteobacteria bacterium]
MRSNIIFGLLLLMLVALVGGLWLRGRDSHQAPAPRPEPTSSASAAPSAATTASATATTSAAATPTGSASATPVPAPPKLGRPLRVVGLGWELLAAGIMANDGVTGGKASLFAKQGLEVELSAFTDVLKLENTLARGGKDAKGADVAIMPLPRFVASYERLKALDPVIFLVVGWSEGREVVLSKHKSFAALPAQGTIAMRGTPGDPAAFLGLFALDLAGTPPARVTLVGEGDPHDWAAITRRESKQKSEQTSGHLLLSTGEASRLVPFVAIAQASLVTKEAVHLTTLAKGWLAGHQLVADNASDAARKIGEAKGAPEPLAVLSRMSEITAASLDENAQVAGLSGRGAVTLEALFGRCWQIWREAKVLSIPPERAPVDGTIIAALVRAGGELSTPPPTAGGSTPERPETKGQPLVVYRAPKGKLDEGQLVETIGFIAGVFRRSPLRITAHPRVGVDSKLTDKLVEQARERFGLGAGRLEAGKTRGVAGAPATIEVLPVP